MAKTTTTMSKINKQMDVKKMAKTMQNFEKENMKMEMTEEMMNDAMGKFYRFAGQFLVRLRPVE